MRIPNKFNGYSADNIRLYNDPVTLTALATQAGGLGAAGAALGTAGTGAALGTAAAATIPELAGAGALGSMVGTGEGLAATLPQITGSASTLAQASPEIAANLASGSAQGITQGLGQTGGEVAGQMQNAGDVMKAAQAGGAPPATNPMPNAGFQPTPGTQPGPLPNVPTVPSPADAQTAANYYSNAQNADIASKVASQTVSGPQSGGIMDQLKNFTDPLTSGFQKAMDYAKENPKTTAAGLYGLSKIIETKPSGGKDKYKGSSFDYNAFNTPTMNPLLYGANGGIMSSYADGGPVEQMSNMNAIGGNEMYPMANIPRLEYANPVQQRPVSENIMSMGGDAPTDPYTGQLKFAEGGMASFRKQLAKQEAEREAEGEALYQHGRGKVENRGVVSYPLSESSTDPYTASVNRMKKANQVAGIKMHPMPKINMPESFSVTEAAGGGIMHGDLGGYSDGGRLLKGPGDGVSDSIPAVIGNKQPARLADGEFVVPARIVSELGNGSTEAGARKLYAMMERIQKGRSKSVGKNKVAVNSKSDKHLPA
jgi:hypothetical protein